MPTLAAKEPVQSSAKLRERKARNKTVAPGVRGRACARRRCVDADPIVPASGRGSRGTA
jgi:hypothetical protein